MGVTMKTCVFWVVLFLGIVDAWPFDPYLSNPVPIPTTGLSIRDDTSQFTPSEGCQAACKSSGCSGCNAKTKRTLGWVAGDVDLGSGGNGTQEEQVWKRMLAPVTQSNVGKYVKGLSNGDDVVSIVSENDERYISFSVQEKFEDHPDTNNPLVVGVDGGFLTGCTVLTVVSRRAVYMAHFYQDLGFDLIPPVEPDDPKPDFQRNVLNLIQGSGNLFYADGPGIDTSLFTGDGDMPYASIMAPRHNNQGKSLYFRKKTMDIAALVNQLIPGCRVDTYKYFAESKYPKNQPERGVAIFEYDANADGQGNGDWRLFEEAKVTRGRLLGQNVIPLAGGS